MRRTPLNLLRWGDVIALPQDLLERALRDNDPFRNEQPLDLDVYAPRSTPTAANARSPAARTVRSKHSGRPPERERAAFAAVADAA